MRFLTKKQQSLAVLCMVFVCGFLSTKWQGYVPFSDKEPLVVGKTTGKFFIPVPEKTKHYTKFIMVEGSCTTGNPCDCTGEFKNVPESEREAAEKNFDLLNDWCKQDHQSGMLFRPYVFYDVMGTMEWDFQGQPKKKGASHDWENARKKSGILTAIWNANGDASQLKAEDFKDELESYPGRQALLGSKFEVKSVDALRTAIKTGKKSSTPGSFEILDGYQLSGRKAGAKDAYEPGDEKKVLEALKQTDVRYLIETHPGAVFQLASNANCLEGKMFTKRLEEMQSHPAQGEEASLATMGGAIIRKYGLKEQPSLLKGLAEKKIIKLNAIDFSRITNVNSLAKPDDDIGVIAIGIHGNVPVTSGYAMPWSKSLPQESPLDEKNERVRFLSDNYFVAQRETEKGSGIWISRDPLMVFNKFINYADRKPVDLILTTAFDIDRGHIDGDKNMISQVAKTVLKAAYLGTILATAYLGKKELYLTLVGTGAFGNPFDFVIDAFKVDGKLDDEIVSVVRDYGIKVTFVIYPDLKVGRGTKPSEVAKLNQLIKDLNVAINTAQKESSETGSTASSAVTPGELELRNLAWVLEQMSQE